MVAKSGSHLSAATNALRVIGIVAGRRPLGKRLAGKRQVRDVLPANPPRLDTQVSCDV